MKPLSNWKTGTARALAIGGVAMGLTGTMALQQAAPAEALVFLAPLAPVIGAAVGGTGITTAGWAAIAGGAAAIGAALHWGHPDQADDLDRAIDWLMEPVDILGRPLNAEGQEVDDPKPLDDGPDEETIVTGCYTSACPKTLWVNEYATWDARFFSTNRENPIGCVTNACSTTRSLSVGGYFNSRGRYSGGSQDVVMKIRLTCQTSSGAPVIEHTFVGTVGSGSYQGDASSQWNGKLSCPLSKGHVRDVVIEPALREEVCAVLLAGCTDSTNRHMTGGVADSITYTADVPDITHDKKIRTTVVCRDSAGVLTTITADSPVSAPSATIPSCASRGLGEAVSITSDIYDGDILRKNIFSGSGTAGAGQKLEIWVDGMPCQVGWQACESWPGLSVTAPDRVKCYLGGAEVALSQCNYLEGAYLVGGTPATKTNIDGNPATWTPPSTIPGWIPHEESASGPQPNPNITPSPDPNPSPEPSIKPEPAPNTGTAPGTGTSTGGSTVTNPTAPPGGYGGNCWSGTSAWNPIEWVYMPVSCALQAAFVPTLNITARMQSIGNLLQTKPPFVWLNEGIAGPAATGCPNWVVTVGGLSKNVVCDSSFTAAIVGARSPLFVLMSTAMVWPLIRSLWYASIPFVKATPTGGK